MGRNASVWVGVRRGDYTIYNYCRAEFILRDRAVVEQFLRVPTPKQSNPMQHAFYDGSIIRLCKTGPGYCRRLDFGRIFNFNTYLFCRYQE